jgi:hypothetical protein
VDISMVFRGRCSMLEGIMHQPANIPYCLMQSTGAFIAVSRYASATPCPPSVMSRGIGWQVPSRLLNLQIFCPSS